MKKVLSQASAYIVAKEQEKQALRWVKYTRENCRKSNKEKHHGDKFFFNCIYKDLKEFTTKEIERFFKALKTFQTHPSNTNYIYMIDRYDSLMACLINERRFCQ